MSEEERSSVQEENGEATFRFRDGNVYKSTKKVKFPVNIIGNRAYVILDVVVIQQEINKASTDETRPGK